ncbi:MAG: head GIN domain-containing protein [Ferruginibacter sp.]
MKKIAGLLIFVAALVVSAKAQKQLVVDANAEMRSLNGSFNKIKVSSAIDLYLSQAASESIAVSASEDKFKEGIKTVIENGVLKIYYEGDRNWGYKNRKMKVYVSFKNISELHASGASDIVVAGTIDVNDLEMHLSGASDFKGDIKAITLRLNLSGASDVTISGSVKQLKIESSGASDVKGFDLTTDFCSASVSGASDVHITVNKELTAHASGASSVSYKGEGVIKDMHSSGASSINKKG